LLSLHEERDAGKQWSDRQHSRRDAELPFQSFLACSIDSAQYGIEAH
jgi:hypothetical protein